MKTTFTTLIVILLLFFINTNSYSQIPTSWGTQLIPAGSKIIDMGITPQTQARGLKPYGLVYELIKNYNVPVLWAINSSKTKDGTDFIQDGITYKGGPFIIKAGYLTSAVNTLISNWVSQGVTVRTTTTAGNLPVFKEMNSAPVWVIDQDNPNIPTGFMADAGIPSSAYSTKSNTLLNSCDNLFVMPHADPTWATHSRIYSWVKSTDSTNGCQGWFWGGCHAVSVFENLVNPSISWQKMNFLSTNGLVPYGSHNDGSTPYINDSFPSNPIMQFMGTIDAATTNGSERIYLPSLASAWRSKVQVGVYDPTQQNVPALSPGKAAALIFGPAFNDYNAGYVAYESGHDVSGNNASNIAAERIFFNFSFLAPLMQNRSLSINSCNIPDTIYSGNTQTLTVTVSGTGTPFTYSWTSTCSGAAFSAPTAATTNLTIPPSSGNCIVTITVTNACGKTVFCSKPVVVVNVGILPLDLFKHSIAYADAKAKLYWEVTDETNGHKYNIERSEDGRNFSVIGSVPVTSQSAGIHNYDDASVNALQSDNLYYRIRLLMADGKEKLSQIMLLRKGSANITRPTIKPSLARSYISVNLFVKKTTTATLSLVSSDGKTVYSKKLTLTAGENSLWVNELDKFAGGMYSAVITTDKETVAEKFFIFN